LLRATSSWVRSITVADPELAEACADLEAQAAAIADLTPRERLGVLGALMRAAVTRGDYAAVLAGRQTELALALQLQDQNAVDAAESNLVNALVNHGRYAEAAEQGWSLLERVDADGSGSNGNLPWVLSSLFAALVALGRLDEARALLPRAFAAGRRFDTPTPGLQFCVLAAAEQRLRAAARLMGYTRQSHEARSMTFDPEEETVLARVLAAACASLGAEQAATLVERGRSLTDDQAQALVAGDQP
jgi:non-specific serine/threonine protein kinase